MNGYIGYYNRHRYEVQADGLWPAKQAVMAAAKQDFPRHGDKRIALNTSVMLAERDGAVVIHDPAELP